MLLYHLQTIYVSFGLVLSLANTVLVAVALRPAQARRQRPLTDWLAPLLVAHALGAAYFVYVLAFRWLGLRTTLASTLTALGVESVTGLIGVYAAARLVSFVRAYCHALDTDREAAWPPPPRSPVA